MVQSIRLTALVPALLLASCAKRYRADGIVLTVNRAEETVLVSHRAIGGYMEPMAMPFHVAHPKELDGIAPGAKIQFRLTVRQRGSSIADIRRIGPDWEYVPVPQPARKLRPGEPAPDWTLTDQHSQPVRLSGFRGRTVVLDFIYTRCPMPDVCPRLSANMALLQKRFQDRVTLLSVTIDPQYDTPEVLAGYAKRWQAGPNWHFLTGTGEQIRRVAGPFGLVYWPEEGAITHSSVTAVIGQDGIVKAVLEGSTFTGKQLVDMLQTVLEGSK